MDDTAKLLIDSYANLLVLFEKQLEIAVLDRYDSQLSQLQELEQEKRQYQLVIDQINADTIKYEFIIANYRDDVAACIKELQRLNATLQLTVKSWYNEDSKIMKQVSVQRKTLQSYGGVNDTDVISYYFDEKR
jgi:hypothetical protein